MRPDLLQLFWKALFLPSTSLQASSGGCRCKGENIFPSIWTLDCLEQIQLAARRGLKLGASGLQHPALLPLGRGVTKWYVSSFPINGFPAPTQHQLKLRSIFPYWLLPHAHRKKSLPHVSIVAKSVDLNKPWSCKYSNANDHLLPW